MRRLPAMMTWSTMIGCPFDDREANVSLRIVLCEHRPRR
jgi:hypothetical protein